MELLADIEDLLSRLDWELDDEEVSVAEGALEDASSLVRAHGNPLWGLEDGVPTPALARTIALSSARRFMVNTYGLTASRAGDETMQWGDVGDKAGAPYLTRREEQLLARLARGNRSGLVSVPTFAWQSRPAPRPFAGHVPAEGPTRAFPMFAEEGPW